jgi:hypothetical protein
VTIAALVLVLASRPAADRPWWILIGFAAASVPISLASGTEDLLPAARFAYLVAGTLLVTAWAPKAPQTKLLEPPTPVPATSEASLR